MKMNKNKLGISAVIGTILMVAIMIAIATTVYVYVNDLTEKEKSTAYVTTGFVTNTEYIGDCIRIDFINGSYLHLHGSPNAKYTGMEMLDLIVVNNNYSFFYHIGTVMSDGNIIYWFDGNVIDKIRVNQ